MSKYHQILRYPSITEKNTNLRADQNKFVFEVALDATKADIKEAVQKLWEVDVETVNTMIVKGKKKRMGRNVGYRPDRKKAVVKLKAGQTIPAFGEV
jgi:large subunit ribosomal protein L23